MLLSHFSSIIFDVKNLTFFFVYTILESVFECQLSLSKLRACASRKA